MPSRGPSTGCWGALANWSRRPVLAYFEGSDDEIATLDDLAEVVGTHRTAPDGRPPERVRSRLHHADLPRLAAAGFIEYDPRTSTVRYHGHGLLEEYRTHVDEGAAVSTWSR